MVRIGFDGPEVIPKTREELARIMENIQIGYKLSFRKEIVDDRETDNRFTGFMTFNPEKPKEKKGKTKISKGVKQFAEALNRRVYFY